MPDEFAAAPSTAMCEGHDVVFDPDADPQEIAAAVNALADWLDDQEPADSES